MVTEATTVQGEAGKFLSHFFILPGCCATLAHCEPRKLIEKAWANALVLRPTTPFLRLLKGGIANYEIIAWQLWNDCGSVSSSAVLRR
jgi:hypothetical protein